MFLLVCYGYLMLFEHVLRIKIKKKKKKKKCENEDLLNLFLNRPNFMRNGIIITMLLLMAFVKVTHLKGVSFS